MKDGEDVDDIEIPVGDRDKDEWILFIEGIEGVLGDHVDHKKEKVDATDDCHCAEATQC